MPKIKNYRDFILGFFCYGVGTYLAFSNSVIRGKTLFIPSVLLGRADVYVRIIGGVLMVLSLLVFLRSFGLLLQELREEAPDKTNWLIVASFISFFLYILLLKPFGFLSDSVWFITFLVFIMRIKELDIDIRDGKAVIYSIGISLLVAVIVVGVLFLAFRYLLDVTLP